MQYKVRKHSFGGKERNYAITIPKEIITLIGSDTKFFIDYDANLKTICLTSGASIFPTPEEVKNFSFKNEDSNTV